MMDADIHRFEHFTQNQMIGFVIVNDQNGQI